MEEYKPRSVFGSTCQVKLDIFHAVQRVVQKIPTFHSQCARDMGLVFRAIGDSGIRRTEPTPCIATILSKLKSFVKKWENVIYDGKRVLSEAAMDKIRKVEVHINKGCLSDIPTGCGTNRNAGSIPSLYKNLLSSKQSWNTCCICTYDDDYLSIQCLSQWELSALVLANCNPIIHDIKSVQMKR